MSSTVKITTYFRNINKFFTSSTLRVCANLYDLGADKDYAELMDVILELRQECRAQKQYALADAIRDKLSELGNRGES